jgi:hypothetical protein
MEGITFYSNLENIGPCTENYLIAISGHCGTPGACDCYCYTEAMFENSELCASKCKSEGFDNGNCMSFDDANNAIDLLAKSNNATNIEEFQTSNFQNWGDCFEDNSPVKCYCYHDKYKVLE